MIAFHLIISAYGFWLPNDPRGSWSDFVAAWELRKFGAATKVNGRRSYAHDPHNVTMRREAKRFLKYPRVRFDAAQRDAVVAGFVCACREGSYDCLAGCVGYDHAHLVIGYHEREITVIAGHLKSAATKLLVERDLHPLGRYVGKRGTPPTPWSEGCWKVFIDDRAQVASAIAYVQRHPSKEGLPPQSWAAASAQLA